MAARRERLPGYRLAGVLLCLSAISPAPVFAASLSDADFATLAARCAPGLPEGVLRGVARTESNFYPWMLHDNSTHFSASPASLANAEAQATAWIAEGHSVDIGLMQINSANLPALGMTIGAALDPCTSLAGGAAVLRAAYGAGPVGSGQQAALLMALSIYNTGSPLKGIMNGYARRVMRHANEAESGLSASPLPPATAPDMPPVWDVSAMGHYAQAHGAPWLVPLGLDATRQSNAAAAEAGSPLQTMRSP
ncbi:lytic transglycosylase domain-containing protein [Acidocella sp.]|uniref:lytic transglycosylase domain-containing protein n=1 Tax=Acidocella sp. TaxID=50710 RepID=UPI00260C5C7D|nr:lytic transglycosylase domain-containing protein [Acidocella sp.]MDD2795757.1 lytic transglycosylase domain-containing protein [Acidocella sp.]